VRDGATISVIVPVLDEEARIGRRLAELEATPGVDEVIVVDGGSADRTAAVASDFPAVRVLSAPRGRGPQMNAGAAAASGAVLLFLHADVSLPRDAAVWIAGVLADPAVVAGAFRTWTVPDAGRCCTWPTSARGSRASPTATRRSSSGGRRSRAPAGSPISR